MSSNVTDIVRELNKMRPLWPRIARDITLMNLAQVSSSTAMSYEDICENYDLSMTELSVLTQRDEFRDMLIKEKARAEALGHRAGFLLRSEVVAIEAVEKIHALLTRNNGLEFKDVVKGAEVLVKMTGLGMPEEKAAGPSVAIQINVPTLNNPKLAHLTGPPA